MRSSTHRLYKHSWAKIWCGSFVRVLQGKRTNMSIRLSVVVQLLSDVWLFATPWTAAHQASLSLPTPRACSKSCPLSRWYHPIISSSVIPSSSCLQSFPAAGSFPVSQFFASGGQRIGASASVSVLPVNIPLGFTDLISMPSRVSQESSPTPQFKSTNYSVLSFFVVQLSHRYSTTRKKHGFDYMELSWQSTSLLFKCSLGWS